MYRFQVTGHRSQPASCDRETQTTKNLLAFEGHMKKPLFGNLSLDMVHMWRNIHANAFATSDFALYVHIAQECLDMVQELLTVLHIHL